MDHPEWRRRLAILRDRSWTGLLPIYTFLVEHDEGLFLFDSGEVARAAGPGYTPWWHPYFRWAVDIHVAPEDEVGPRLRALGIDPRRDLRRLVLSHLHHDHADGLGHFEGTPVVVSGENWRAAQGLQGTVAGALPSRWPAWFDPQRVDVDGPPAGPFPHTWPVTADGRIFAVETPGHMPGHLSLVVRADDVTYFLAGDATYAETFLKDEIVDGAAASIATSVDTLRRIKEFARTEPLVLLPAHDPLAAERLIEKRLLRV
jgi:glyoxylase-like metal-dependent hydrolase (beta-lactamase superfamily II)